MDEETKALLTRAVVALEKIADAMWDMHGMSICDHAGDISGKLEDDEGQGIGESLRRIADGE